MSARPERRPRRGGGTPPPQRNVNYRTLKNPFPPMDAVSADRAEAMHEMSQVPFPPAT